MNFSFWPFLWFGLPGPLLRNSLLVHANFRPPHTPTPAMESAQKYACFPKDKEQETVRIADQFLRAIFKEIPSFFCGVTPSKTLAAPQPLNIAFSLGNGGVLRSEEGGGFRKEGDGGEGEKRRKKGRSKSAQIVTNYTSSKLPRIRAP